MSIWNYLCDNEWLQRDDINQLARRTSLLRRRTGHAARVAKNLAGRVEQLEDEVARRTLLNETVLRLLERKGVLPRAEFRSLLVEIDLEDGVMDGKRAPPERPGRPAPCRWCLAENPAGTRNCGKCGKPLAALKPLRRKGP
jgi:hypothetical protein